MTSFSSLLVKLRKSAGFKTAYQFYHKNGGQRVLGLTFGNYLRAEEGKSLPKPKNLPLWIHLLHLKPQSKEVRELCWSYLHSWLKSEEFIEILKQEDRALKIRDSQVEVTKEAIHKNIKTRVFPITPKQFEAIASSPETYWSHLFLNNTQASISLTDLSAALKTPLDSLRKALAQLKTAGLIDIDKDKVRGRLAGKYTVLPPRAGPFKKLYEKLDTYRSKITQDNRLFFSQFLIMRAEEKSFMNFLPYFSDAVRTASAYAVFDNSRETPLFLVEGRILKVF